jgi:phosphate transport system permease protein
MKLNPEDFGPAASAEERVPAAMHESRAEGFPDGSVAREFLQGQGSSSRFDRLFRWITVIGALTLFAIVALILFELLAGSRLSFERFGLGFFTGQGWNTALGDFGAVPFIYGTAVSSGIALLIAIPLALGAAIFLTEMCPAPLRSPLAFLVELLAAIPSVVYGLWGLFVLAPLLRGPADSVLRRTLDWTGLTEGANYGTGMLAAGIILAIMVLPVILSLTREVMSSVPHAQREALLALGATRWEMIKIGVLRNARIGILGAIILGLGRAFGETIAVTMVIGNRPEIVKSLFARGATMASVLANEFGGASGELYRSALVEIGLALFVVTVLVNGLARVLVWVVARGTQARARAF